MTAYFLNAGDAFVVSACYSVSCPTNTIPCEGRGVLRPCGEEFKPLFMRYRSSLDRFRCNPAEVPRRHQPCFLAISPLSTYRFPRIACATRLHPGSLDLGAITPQRFRHGATLILGLGCSTCAMSPVKTTPYATVLLFSRGDRYSPVAPILLRPTPCSHTEQRIGFRARPWLFDVFVLEPRSVVPFTCARAFASLSHTRALLLPSSFAC